MKFRIALMGLLVLLTAVGCRRSLADSSPQGPTKLTMEQFRQLSPDEQNDPYYQSLVEEN